MASFHCLLWKVARFVIVMCSEKRTFAWCRCTPLPIVDMFCEKIKVIQHSTQKIWNMHVDEFSRLETKVYMNTVGIGIARDGSTSDSDGVLLARQVVFHEFGDVLSADHVIFDLCHPYIDCLSTVWWGKISGVACWPPIIHSMWLCLILLTLHPRQVSAHVEPEVYMKICVLWKSPLYQIQSC